jgi:hypothetical protein
MVRIQATRTARRMQWTQPGREPAERRGEERGKSGEPAVLFLGRQTGETDVADGGLASRLRRCLRRGCMYTLFPNVTSKPHRIDPTSRGHPLTEVLSVYTGHDHSAPERDGVRVLVTAQYRALCWGSRCAVCKRAARHYRKLVKHSIAQMMMRLA